MFFPPKLLQQQTATRMPKLRAEAQEHSLLLGSRTVSCARCSEEARPVFVDAARHHRRSLLSQPTTGTTFVSSLVIERMDGGGVYAGNEVEWNRRKKDLEPDTRTIQSLDIAAAR